MGLRTQISILVLTVLLAAQLLAAWLFVDERSLAIQAAIGAETAARAANVAKLIEGAPQELHDEIVEAATSPLVQFGLSDAPAIDHSHHDENGAVEARIRALLNDSFSRDIRVELHEVESETFPVPNLSPELAELHSEMMQGTLATVEMEISIAIAGGKWLNVGTRFERPPIQWSAGSMASFVTTAGILLLVIFWFILTRITRPLRELAIAAETLGRGSAGAALKPRGPREVRELTGAFNDMQSRLARFVEDRTQMLAALAHDLRSPLTALRVHSELVSDDETRDGLATSIEEMQDMVEATLFYASGVGQNEQPCSLEIADFIGDLVQASSSPVSLTPGPQASILAKPNSLRRAFRNVLENAQRYGGAASVSWKVSGNTVIVEVVDRGPGIADAELENVFLPYVRLERSRSLATGGHGLGLSIARSILLEHGGQVALANRPEGGLRVSMVLPLARSGGGAALEAPTTRATDNVKPIGPQPSGASPGRI